MQYITKDGRQVCRMGWVIINTERHYVYKGYVYCNASLNGRAWNTTTAQSTCPKCGSFAQQQHKQLSLF